MSNLRRIRILYINHTGLVSGAERVLIDTLRTLDRERYEPVVMCPAYGDLAEEIFALRAEWIPLPSVRARFAWRPDRLLRSMSQILAAVRVSRKQIRAVSPDLIHANSVRAGLVASLAAARTHIPVIWHVHDILPRHPVSTVLRMFLLAARNTRVIGVSGATTRSLCGRFPLAARVHTIHNGVDLTRFNAERHDGETFRNELGLSEDDFLICAIGQICARKGLLELIDAFRRVCSQGRGMHLAIVGKVVFRHEESYQRDLYAAAKSWGIEDRVHFCGERRDISTVLHGSDLLALNSRDEPFGLVLIEAMASGTPVLATRVGGIPEIVTDAVNGWLVEPGDTAGLARKLEMLSRQRDAIRRTTEQALLVTCPKFSLDRHRQELAALYAALCSHRQTRQQQQARPTPAGSTNY